MRSAILAATLAVLALAGCGGDEETPPPATGAEGKQVPQASFDYVKPAEAICVDMIAEAKRLGAALQKKDEFPSDPLKTTTRYLIAPAIPVVEASARRLRALEGESSTPEFEAYVDVYDPILALLRERVEAGEAGERERAQDLEAQTLDLALLQQQLARVAGLDRCDVDFVQAFATPGS